ncbi:MAG: hypothetical protein NUV46_04430, partial [Nanoarchaeota archaeon]|nr:hypothetical protein [Nanoarchaeota archaeon]
SRALLCPLGYWVWLGNSGIENISRALLCPLGYWVWLGNSGIENLSRALFGYCLEKKEENGR